MKHPRRTRRSSRPYIVALAAMLGLALAGCTPTDDPGAAPTATAEAPAPDAAQTPEPTPEPEPRGVFDGDCGAAMPEADVAAVIGAGSTLESADGEQIAGGFPLVNTSVREIGGLRCQWRTATAQLRLTLLPAERVAVADTGVTCEDDPAGACDALVTEATTVIGLQAYTGVDTEAVRAAVDTVLAGLRARVTDDGGAILSAQEPAALPSCEAVHGLLASVTPALTAGYPGDAIPTGPIWDAVVASGALQYCGFAGQRDALHVTIQPGPAVPTAAQFPGAEEVPVAGADVAWYGADASGSPVLIAVADPGWISLTLGSGDLALTTAYAEALIAGL